MFIVITDSLFLTLFMCLMAVLGLRCCVDSLSCGEQGLLFVTVPGLLLSGDTGSRGAGFRSRGPWAQLVQLLGSGARAHLFCSLWN